jgi:hypothetical protein
MTLPGVPDEVWEALMFYEQIKRPPPLLLRLLVPATIRTEGRKWIVGEAVKCCYVDGHLIKRVTHVDRGRNYAFEVIEQHLALGGGIRVLGGSYRLRALPAGAHSSYSEDTVCEPQSPPLAVRAD